MTQEQIDEVYAELAAYKKEITDHNEQILKSLGKKAQRDFESLIEYCNVTEKIEFVDNPKGHDNKENCGVFKNVHVEQWTTNMEGDCFEGFIYARINGQWIKVPFSC